jgi:hypothetical protein
MSNYHQNAFVSISAAASANCNEGFLKPRMDNPYLSGPFELPYCGRGSMDGPLGSVKLVKYHDYASSMDPITARAWAMQEYLLAPRVLSYGYRNLSWSCRTCSRSCGGPYRQWHDFTDRLNWSKLQEGKTLGHARFYPIDRWKELVQSYTARALTVSKDKLPAISGIAQEYAQILETYLQEAFRLTYTP